MCWLLLGTICALCFTGTNSEVIVVAVTTGNGSSPAVQVLSHSLSLQLPLASQTLHRTSRHCSTWTCPRRQSFLILEERLLLTWLSDYIVLTGLQPGSARGLWEDTDRAVFDLRSFLRDTSTPCSLLDVVNISNSYTVYCLQSGTIHSCDLNINFTDLPE